MARNCIRFALVAALGLLLPAAASATPYTATYTNGGYSATAVFDITAGGDLQVTLTNTSSTDPFASNQILTGIFFDFSGDPTLTADSAVICGTCSVTNGGGTDLGGSVGGEFAYKQGTDIAYGADYGIASSGLGVFGPGDLFGGTNFSGPVSPDGIQYGIANNNDGSLNDNGGLAGVPLVMNQVIFTLAGNLSGLDLSSLISNATFQWGTALGETPVPEPSSLALLFLGLGGLVVAQRRRRVV